MDSSEFKFPVLLPVSLACASSFLPLFLCTSTVTYFDFDHHRKPEREQDYQHLPYQHHVILTASSAPSPMSSTHGATTPFLFPALLRYQLVLCLPPYLPVSDAEYTWCEVARFPVPPERRRKHSGRLLSHQTRTQSATKACSPTLATVTIAQPSRNNHDALVQHYLAALGTYHGLYIPNWIYWCVLYISQGNLSTQSRSQLVSCPFPIVLTLHALHAWALLVHTLQHARRPTPNLRSHGQQEQFLKQRQVLIAGLIKERGVGG
ncbi:hypothetical protein BGY98DRAFT_167675 [Russula aff. rugulosa BPL654]|nr:hypothetical protein BGY98DRAFT_167675 [Russula aff. rugulosa BPL654]